MSWELYRWIWLLEGPLAIGAPPSGSLSRVRLYVPARALWGALTAEVVRTENENADAAKYEEVGQAIREQARLTYLYPAERIGSAWGVWLPEYRQEKGLVWTMGSSGDACDDRHFRRQLLYTRPGTAIDPSSDAAKETTLHETECVQPRWRTQAGVAASEVAIVGYVFAERTMKARLDLVDVVFLGGDTRYGLGRVRRIECKPASDLFDAQVELRDGSLCVHRSRVLGHSPTTAAMTGSLEMLGAWDVGRMLGVSGGGIQPLWVPGSSSVSTASSNRWVIEKDGFWTKLL
jgi:hypothetical protein